MGIRIYNTLTNSIEDFRSLKPGEVGMYACGITVYDDAHIGHASQAVIFDVIRSFLEYRGYKVTYVRNYTDVDDRIIARASRENRDPLELSAHYIRETTSDLARLKVKPPSFEPKVSDHIGEIIDFIGTLVGNGAAYESGGDVFFSVASFEAYGRLSNRSGEDLVNGEETGKKRNPRDFALWKSAKPGEPSWPSPWGAGRPGWHIECSAMARKYLGDSFDIHGGGVDLVFPHHENEIAQSESLTGQKLATYWIHNGLVMVNKQKMSKSLGNFQTVKSALERYHPDVIRYLILSHVYSSNIDFSDDSFRTSEKRLYYLYKTLEKADTVLAGSDLPQPDPDLTARFEAAMDDNFNTACVIAVISETFSEANRRLKESRREIGYLGGFRAWINLVGSVLNFLNDNPSSFLRRYNDRALENAGMNEEELIGMIAERTAAKNRKDWKAADEIRDRLAAKGIRLLDSPEGTTWEIII